MNVFTSNIYHKHASWRRLNAFNCSMRTAIHIDARSFVWTAGDRLLERFDGTNINQVLPRLNISELLQVGFAPNDRWWALTKEARLLSLDLLDMTLTDHTASLPSIDGAYWLWTSADSNDIIIGVPDNLIRFDGQCASLIPAPVTRQGKINGATISPSGDLWFTSPAGLHRVDAAGTHLTSLDALGATSDIWELITARDGTVWIGTGQDGIIRVRNGKAEKLPELELMINTASSPLFEDHAGNIWLKNYALGLICVTPIGNVAFTTEDGISSSLVHAGTEDQQHKLWFCCRTGRPFVCDADTSVTLARQCINATYQEPGQALYMATPSSGIMRYQDNRLDIVSKDITCPSGSALALLPDRKLLIMLGISRKLRTVDLDTGTVTAWIRNSARHIFTDSTGGIWILSDSGIERLANGETHCFSPDSVGFSRFRYVSFYEDDDGRILLFNRFEPQVVFFDGTHFRPFINLSDQTSGGISCLCSDRNGVLWLATTHGLLFRLDGRRTTQIDCHAGTQGAQIDFIIADNRNTLWMGTNTGVFKYDGTVFQQITEESGLPDDTVTGLHGIGDDVVVCTTRGICRIHPNSKTSPYAYVTHVITNEEHHLPESIETHTGIPSVTIHYGGASTKKGRIKYLCRLDGYDDQWRETWDPYLRYDKLPKGEYLFQVRAVDIDMMYSTNTAELPVRVQEDPAHRQIERLEVELQTAEDFSANIIRSIHDAIIVIDTRGIIKMINYAAINMLNYDKKDLIDSPISKILGDSANVILDQGGIKAILDQGVLRNRECNFLASDGTPLPALLSVSVICNRNGETGGLVLAATDIRGYKDLQDQIFRKQKMESLGILAGGIAHDFNNLLGVIVGNTDLVRSQLLKNAENETCLNDALKAARHAAKLCNELLNYTGKAIVIDKQVDLSKQVEDLIDLLKSSISKKITLTCDLSQNLPAVLADDAQITQVILNLITNAAEAIGDKTGTITVRTSSAYLNDQKLESPYIRDAPPAGDYVVLEVEDDGCGMDEATLAHICDPFFSTKFTGRGLGMASVLGIAQYRGGSISVSSKLGTGTTIRVCLPAKGKIENKRQDREADRGIDQALAGGTILLVDDEAGILSMSKLLLSHSGFSVITASDGMEAVEQFRQHAADIMLIVMDITMPRMDGREAYNLIREIDPAIPVIMSSGYSRTRFEEDFRDAPLVTFLPKPYNRSQLNTAIQKAFPPER